MIGRPGPLELDQHAGCACLIDVGVGEAHRRRAVGVAVELLVQLLGVRVELVGLLAQPQLGDLVRAGGVQVGGEHLLVPACEWAASSTQPGSRVRRSAAQALPSSR